MTNKDKMLIGFLVAAGFFSLSSAAKYVNSLSDNQKSDLCIVAEGGAALSPGDIPRVENGNNRSA